MLMVTLDNVWNNMLNWEVSDFWLKVCRFVTHSILRDLYGKKNTLACLALFSCFWPYKCPCNFPLDKTIALKLHSLIYYDLIFKLK